MVLNLDDVLHWSPIPEMHEEVADVKGCDAAGPRVVQTVR